MFNGKFYKEWRLTVCTCSSVDYIDGFNIGFSCFFYEDNETYFDLEWIVTDGIDYESAFGIISVVFSGFEFYLSPIFASEVYAYED